MTSETDAVTRRVGTITRGGTALRVVTVRRTYGVAPGAVWSAVVEPDGLARWWAPVQGDLEVLERAEPDRLSVSCAADGRASWIDLSLRPVADGTLLQLDHSVPRDARWDELGPAGVGLGWEDALARLATRLDGPDSAADDLTVAASTEEWVEAAIADGDDPDGARAAAVRCVSTYADGRP